MGIRFSSSCVFISYCIFILILFVADVYNMWKLFDRKKCDQASDLWQQIELVSELESDLQDTLYWGRKWFVDFNAEKTQLVLFGWSNNTGAIDVKVDGFVFEETSYFKMLGLTFSSKLDWGCYIISIVKTASKKIAALICFMKFFFFLRLLFISTGLSYIHVWNTVVMSRLALLLICYMELLEKLQKW